MVDVVFLTAPLLFTRVVVLVVRETPDVAVVCVAVLREAEVRVACWVVLLVAGEAVVAPRVAVAEVVLVAPRVAVAELVLVAREALLPVVSCF